MTPSVVVDCVVDALTKAVALKVLTNALTVCGLDDPVVGVAVPVVAAPSSDVKSDFIGCAGNPEVEAVPGSRVFSGLCNAVPEKAAGALTVAVPGTRPFTSGCSAVPEKAGFPEARMLLRKVPRPAMIYVLNECRCRPV